MTNVVSSFPLEFSRAMYQCDYSLQYDTHPASYEYELESSAYWATMFADMAAQFHRDAGAAHVAGNMDLFNHYSRLAAQKVEYMHWHLDVLESAN